MFWKVIIIRLLYNSSSSSGSSSSSCMMYVPVQLIMLIIYYTWQIKDTCRISHFTALFDVSEARIIYLQCWKWNDCFHFWWMFPFQRRLKCVITLYTLRVCSCLKSLCCRGLLVENSWVNSGRQVKWTIKVRWTLAETSLGLHRRKTRQQLVCYMVVIRGWRGSVWLPSASACMGFSCWIPRAQLTVLPPNRYGNSEVKHNKCCF